MIQVFAGHTGHFVCYIMSPLNFCILTLWFHPLTIICDMHTSKSLSVVKYAWKNYQGALMVPFKMSPVTR